jgi:hypothetical protein
MLPELKGPGTIVAYAFNHAHRVQLLCYSDRSCGIRKDGFELSSWEDYEIEDCFRTFLQVIDLQRDQHFYMAVSSTHIGQSIATRMTAAFQSSN